MIEDVGVKSVVDLGCGRGTSTLFFGRSYRPSIHLLSPPPLHHAKHAKHLLFLRAYPNLCRVFVCVFRNAWGGHARSGRKPRRHSQHHHAAVESGGARFQPRSLLAWKGQCGEESSTLHFSDVVGKKRPLVLLHTTTPLAPSWKHLPFVDRFTLTLLVSLGEIDLRCCLVCGILGTRWEKLFSQVTPPPPPSSTHRKIEV